MAPVVKENIALDKKKQSALTKAVKKVIKKSKDEEGEQKNAQTIKRGIIMLSHIPHGFYEKEMRAYFSQFGKVFRIKVARSSKTGRSRGYAFVEFEFEEVAKIAAEAMNNYLMFERLIKCKLMTSEDGNPTQLFKARNIRENNNPKLKARKRVKKEQNRTLSKEETDDIMKQRLAKIEEQNKRFAELGIDYQFPVHQRKEVAKETLSAADEPKTSPKTLKIRKSQGPAMQIDSEAKTTPKTKKDSPKITPKPIKRNSQGQVVQKTNNEAKTTPAKTMKVSPKMSPKLIKRNSQGPVIQNDNEAKRTPAKTVKDSPKMSPSPKPIKSKKSQSPVIQNDNEAKRTPAKAAKDSPKISPKMSLKSRKSQGHVMQDGNEAKKTPAKALKDLPKISPKMLRSRKSQGPVTQSGNEVKKTPAKALKDLPKISPKMLRSRKSQGPAMQGANEAKKTPAKAVKDLPKISPKMLRSRKSQGPAGSSKV